MEHTCWVNHRDLLHHTVTICRASCNWSHAAYFANHTYDLLVVVNLESRWWFIAYSEHTVLSCPIFLRRKTFHAKDSRTLLTATEALERTKRKKERIVHWMQWDADLRETNNDRNGAIPSNMGKRQILTPLKMKVIDLSVAGPRRKEATRHSSLPAEGDVAESRIRKWTRPSRDRQDIMRRHVCNYFLF